ncbi:glycosyltransferase, partial [Candidatus Microgenomates bacterium]|nr:glycosyltransferase [Candidatus Microgenomates bacterium]
EEGKPDSFHKLGYSETLSNDMKLPILMWLLSPFMYFSAMIALFRLVKKEKIDVINAHWALPNGFIASIVSIFTGTPVISTLPGSDVYMAQKNILFNILARVATWKSKWITSNSYQLIKDLSKTTNINLENKSSTIVYGPGSNKFKPDKNAGLKARKELGLDNDDLIILGVGRLVAKKGFKYLIKASVKLIKNFKNVYFVLIGDGEQRIYLENLTKRLKIDSHFKFLGNISYSIINNYYNMTDIFILPSVRDEKGNLDDQSVAVMDAMVCAKPIVTTDFPGYRKVVNSNVNGILVQEKDVNGIYKALNSLLKSKNLRRVMGDRARKTILNDFSWKKIGGQYTNLFNNLMSNYYSLGVEKILDQRGRIRIAKQIYRVLLSRLDNTKNLSCLDVGSSSGIISNFLSNYFKKVVGVDIDKHAVAIAKEEFKKRNLEFKTVVDETLPFKDNQFDVVVCNQVYNFVNNPQKLMLEIHRVLKPNGICFFGARNKWAIIEPQYNIPFGSWFPKLLPFGKKYMGYAELKKLVSKFQINDLTIEILRNPNKYGYRNLKRYEKIAKVLPLNFFEFIIPNFIFILKK